MSDRIVATYHIETPLPLYEAADALAGEQSSGTFVEVPGETDELYEQYGARIEEVIELDDSHEPSLPGAVTPESGTYTRAEIVLSFPVHNIGADLPQLRTMVAGNAPEIREVSGLRLKNLELPSSFASEFPGPQFGIEGTREIVDVWDRPIIGSIIKPNIGLSPDETADIVSDMVHSGVDFIKDDELLANPPYSRVEDRIEAVMDVIHDYRDNTGKEVMYACNITSDVETMIELHDVVQEAGGNCIMVSPNDTGISGLLALRKEAELPIHAHRNGWGFLGRDRMLGFDFAAFQKFWRLAGVDHTHLNGVRNRFFESDASVIRSAQTCQEPIASEEDTIMPVFSSGQWAGQAPDTYDAMGNTDFLYLCGGGIHGHPDGPKAGVEHLKQGWEAAVEGIPLDEYAEDHKELERAIEKFGPVGSGR